MVNEFLNQNYLIIESNVVTNIVMWDGNTITWTPPQGSIALIKGTTPAMMWNPVVVEAHITDWVLAQEIGTADIGFTWDGTVLTTNQPKPAISV